MEFFPLLIICFLIFIVIFLFIQLLLFIFRKYFKKNDHLKKWSKEQFDQIQSLLKANPGLCSMSDPKMSNPSAIFDNLRYTNTVNSMSINLEYDNQRTISDNCDSYDGYKSRVRKVGSVESPDLEKVFDPVIGDSNGSSTESLNAKNRQNESRLSEPTDMA